MPQYMISVFDDNQNAEPLTPEQIQPIYEAVDAFNTKLREAGKWVFGGGLEPVETATVVDNVKGDGLVTDGPFSESKEYIGGFWVIEAADLDEALEWAKGGSLACQGKVEVRPFQAEPA